MPIKKNNVTDSCHSHVSTSPTITVTVEFAVLIGSHLVTHQDQAWDFALDPSDLEHGAFFPLDERVEIWSRPMPNGQYDLAVANSKLRRRDGAR